jgi:hypothetical protein
MNDAIKPLGAKAYGHIPHLPGSRMGPGDHKCHEGQARIATERTRDRHDRVIVTEKLDGSCCAIANIDSALVTLGRAGWPAQSSPYEQHQLFASWVRSEYERFEEFRLTMQGYRIVGEWLAQAHGTRYDLTHPPFVPFDVIQTASNRRLPYDDFLSVIATTGLSVPYVISDYAATSIPFVLTVLGRNGYHGAIDQVEGAVWRVERKGVFDFICKYVRPYKVDGCYLPEISGKDAVWNWRPL